MFQACSIDVSYYDDQLNTSTLFDINGNPFLITTDEDIKINAIGMPVSIQRKEQLSRRICNAFKDNSSMVAKLLYSRFFRIDRQNLAKNNLGEDFKYVTELYTTFASIKPDISGKGGRGPRNSIYIVYKLISSNTFDMKSALDRLNESLIKFINKENTDEFINNMFDVVCPSYLNYRWKTKEEINRKLYNTKYKDEHPTVSKSSIRKINGVPFRVTIDNIVKECDNIGKDLVDFKQWDLINELYTRVLESIDRMKNEARINYLK